MRSLLTGFLALAVAAVVAAAYGCSSESPTNYGDNDWVQGKYPAAPPSEGGAKDAAGNGGEGGVDGGGGADGEGGAQVTWPGVYATWFEAGTPGNCGDTTRSCHGKSPGAQNFLCDTQANCCMAIHGLQNGPMHLQLVTVYGMPPSPDTPLSNNQAAMNDINAWIAAGANCN
jgi:hypothetical protein